MTKLYRIFKTQLIMAVVLLSATLSFAQIVPKVVVQVPSACIVVVPGYGGNVASAFGVIPVVPGRVGNGGVVVMPDPYDQPTAIGNFTCTTILDASTPTAVTLKSWTLKGDLSFQTATLNNAALQSSVYPATPLTTVGVVNIQSYNKLLRSAENAPLNSWSDASWGRSKGTVSVSYVSGACGGGISFEVYKKYRADFTKGGVFFQQLPVIVGPDCIEPNKTYTFSVDQIASDNATDNIGFDRYFWSGIPTGSINSYTSADNSSITFTTGASFSSTINTLKCGFGRANPYDAVALTNTSFVTKTLGLIPGMPDYIPGSILSSDPSQNCKNTGITSFAVAIAAVAGLSYTWASPDTSWVLTPSGAQGQNLSVGLNANDNNPGKIELTITNGSCTPVKFLYQITRNFTSAISILGPSPTCLVPGSTANAFSIQGATPALGNPLLNPTIWTLPANWTITGATNSTNSAITVTVPTSAAAGTYTVSAKSNSCAGSISTTVNVPPATPAFTQTSANCVLKSATGITNIQVDTSTGAPLMGYVWTVTPAGSGWSITDGNGTSTPTFTSGSGTGPVTINVYRGVAGGTCNSLVATRSISYIALTATLKPNEECDTYSINACGAAVTWTVNGAPPTGNFTLTPSGNTLSLCSATTATVTVCATIAGIATPICTTNTGHGFRLTNSSNLTDPKEIIEGVSIFPNPNNGVFFIKVENIKETASATLTDFSGQEVATYTLKKGTNKLGKETLPKGTYIIVLKVDGIQESRQVIIK